VRFSGQGVLDVQSPPPLKVECIGQVPPAAQTLEEFLAIGGHLTSDAPVRIHSDDTVVTNRPGDYVLTRTYTIEGGCNQARSCEQIITALDEQPPALRCSSGIVQPVDPGCDYATVTFTNLAADSCGELLGPWVPVSTGRFPIGTNTIIVVATDLALNTSACSFDIAVLGGPSMQANLRIVELSGPVATLQLTSSPPGRFAILTSTNLVDWAGVYTNASPFTFRHTNVPAARCRFFRALYLP
jgi:hypothetical protein